MRRKNQALTLEGTGWRQFTPLRVILSLVVLAGVVALWVYLVEQVPVSGAGKMPPVTRDEVIDKWPLAVASLAIVVAVSGIIVLSALLKRRRDLAA